MKIEELPVGSAPVPVDFDYFPTRWQLFIWRNWGLFKAAKLAEVLTCSEQDVVSAAVEMGLPAAPDVCPKWRTNGYLTVIRNNWHLLNYPQLLQLLDWSADKLAYTLKEEDFFFVKLGRLKPNCPPLEYRTLTDAERRRTDEIRAVVNKYFPEDKFPYVDAPFSFADRFGAKDLKLGKQKFDFNFIHSYAASCGDVIGNAETLDPVPENLLAQYASMGIKGVWMHALLYLLCPIPGAEEYSEGLEKRMSNLKKMVAKCEKYGVKIFLYLNEPRCMPMPFYEKKPEWAGVEVPSLNTRHICTSHSKEPLEWLEGAMKKLFAEVPGLGGVFCITMSENPTNCNSGFRAKSCPYCKDVPGEKLIADVITAMERGMHASAPDAKMIAYDWAWREKPEDTDNAAFKAKVLDLLPRSVYVNSVSEWGIVTNIGGVKQSLVDYSISQVGPSDEAKKVWKHAHEIGIKVAAKVQINNSWELSAVPYVPVPYLVQEHLENLKREGVNGLMLSWTLGGYPGGNLELLASTPEEMASRRFHQEVASRVCAAWKEFSEAFRQFPFHVSVLYVAPQNYGPMNPLYMKNTGYNACMIGFPYDNLKGWRSIYPEDVFVQQFRLLNEGWLRGLDILEEARPMLLPGELDEYNEIMTIAKASYCHFNSTYRQICFVRERDNGHDAAAMAQIAKEEIGNAMALYEIARRDSRIGFEASNHYFYTLNDLREKIVNCEAIIEALK